MAIIRFKAGASNCGVGVPNGVALPNLNTLTYTASGVVADTLFNNSNRKALTVGTTYQVAVTLTGQDTTTDGWSDTPSTVASGPLILTAGQNAIVVNIPNANWPANFQYAGYVSVWLKTGAGDFQFCTAAPVDQSNDMSILIKAAPLPTVASVPIATLYASSANASYPQVGDRGPKGFLIVDQSPTTNDITVSFKPTSQITFTPNNSADFPAIGSRSAEITFKTEANDAQTFTRASFGDYGQVTQNGHSFQSMDTAINTASVSFQGNRPFIMTTPTDPSTGVAEQWLFISLQLQNLDEIALAWSKKNETPMPFHFVTVPNDYKTINAPTVFSYSRK